MSVGAAPPRACPRTLQAPLASASAPCACLPNVRAHRERLVPRAAVRTRYGTVVRPPFIRPRPLLRTAVEVWDLVPASAVAGVHLEAAAPI
jgi:hypothetical protein